MNLPADASLDQSNTPDGYYRRSNGMLHQITTQSPQEAPNLSRLDAMSLAELKTLVRRLACQCGMVAGMSKEETAQAMMDELASIALRPGIGTQLRSDINARIAAIDKWMDRSEGKPVQKQLIAAKIETRDMTDPTMVKDLARRLDFILANPAVKLTGHIPKTLDVD